MLALPEHVFSVSATRAARVLGVTRRLILLVARSERLPMLRVGKTRTYFRKKDLTRLRRALVRRMSRRKLDGRKRIPAA